MNNYKKGSEKTPKMPKANRNYRTYTRRRRLVERVEVNKMYIYII